MLDFVSIITEKYVCHFYIGVLENIGLDIANRLMKVNILSFWDKKIVFLVVMGGFELPF